MLSVVHALRLGPAMLEGDSLVAVWRWLPREVAVTVPIGVSAGSAPEALPAARALATAAGRAARWRGLTGLVPMERVATLSALQARDDLAHALLDGYATRLSALPRVVALTETTRVWLECGRDVDAAAARLYVHPNTVRNRTQALVDTVHLDPANPFEAVDLWWLCEAWAQHQR